MLIPASNNREVQALDRREEDFILGQWRVRPQLNRLQHPSGVERQLEPRLMHLLCVLASNPDRVLTRDELVAEIWPRVIVNENSLTRAVSELRKQLVIRDGDNPVYIETIPKRGYRLLQTTLDHSPTAILNGTVRLGRASLLGWQQGALPGSTAFSMALVLLIAGWLGLNSTATETQFEFQPVVLQDEIVDPLLPEYHGDMTVPTSDATAVNKDSAETPVLSKDGSQYAYIKYDHMGSTIYLGDLDNMTEPVPVYYCDTYLYNLAWSPIGNALLFAQKATMTNALYTKRDEAATLMQLDLDTYKLSRLVGEDPASESSVPGNGVNLT